MRERERLIRRLSFFWSEQVLLHRSMLWLLLWVNGLGTIYGYQWYANQISVTLNEHPLWLVFFVPDSPTASLFFTAAIGYLLIDSYRKRSLTHEGRSGWLRGIVEAMAVITSIKYGIWAVLMIFFGAALGDTLNWQHWMLVTSHLGMAFEALLFMRFFTYRPVHIVFVSLWTFSNDYIDYRFGVFPWLSRPLHTYLPAIQLVTILLSLLGISSAVASIKLRQGVK